MKRINFKLFAYLFADLRRARDMQYGDTSAVSAIILWLGIFSLRFLPILLCRIAYFFYCLKLRPLAKVISLLNFFLFGIEIAIRCPIGKGFFLPHTQGTVIGAYSIGENVTIFQGVTLGAREIDFLYHESSRPKVEDDVTIGSGAKVLGNVTLGKGSRIGANSVVLESVPANVLSVGIPAKIVRKLVQVDR